MPTKSSSEVQKKIFKLVIEFLKRSEDHKAFCEWYRTRKKFHRNKKFTSSSPRWLNQGLNFQMFGDIHDPNYSFERWWSDYEKHKTEIQERHKPILSGPELIEQFDAWVHVFKKLRRRNPTVNEVKHFCLEGDGVSFMMKVNVSGNSAQELRKQFKRLILAKKREPIVKVADQSIKRHWKISTEYIRFDELERHLKVYDKFSEGMSVNDIVRAGQFYEPDNQSSKRLVYMDIQKAKKIIDNVERGEFPGKYQGVKAKNR